MQDNTQTQQVIKGALPVILVGMIILAFWAALRPYEDDTRAGTAQTSSTQPAIPQSVRDKATATCADTESMQAYFTETQIDRFCQCATDNIAPYGGRISSEQTTALTYKCLAVVGEV